jgi:prepilin-type N-terminal cleavage/methylation domain-containing protein/prepilin-type processing-associated H-X9-DG protein
MLLQRTARRYRRSRRSVSQGFTLIEILVVVAIIALLIAILIPSLQKAREQARRAACAANLHQQALGLGAYAHDFKGALPCRGYWSYDLAETVHEAYGPGSYTEKTPINLGLLHGDDRKPGYTSYIGKEWKILYCPSVLNKGRETLGTIDDSGLFGWYETRWDSGVTFTYAGYDYALPVLSRTAGGIGLRKKAVYPPETLRKQWITVLGQSQGLPVDESNAEEYRYRVKLRAIQVVATDFGVGGIDGLVHENGLNALYSDGHAKFHQFKNQKSFTSDSLESFKMWHYLTTQP